MSVIHVVTGAMFGSEGKGHVTAQILTNQQLTDTDHRTLNIRVAGPNAGHTALDKNGTAFPLRTIPVGAAVNHDTTLYLAPGSEIELDVLEYEVAHLREHGHPVNRLIISGEATILEQQHKNTETELDMTGKIGSTGKGIGAARADRIMRTATRFIDHPEALALADKIGAVVLNANDGLRFINEWVNTAKTTIVIEGTQGYGLGLHAGHYPQCTSSDARAIDFLAMAGINPWSQGVEHLAVWLVARVYPIRVAGNSGALKGETSWENLGLPTEKTTVTHKTRRVGEWDPELIRQAAIANGANPQGITNPNTLTSIMVALTMADQKLPEIKNMDHWNQMDAPTFEKLNTLIEEVKKDAGVPVTLITTGPSTALVA
jgi:adenylosuccinate synthase